MDIKPVSLSIKNLLSSKRQFNIPRFQRDYSWEKKNYNEFLIDMLKTILIEDNSLKSQNYFLGTMLFVGDPTESSNEEIQVVDGQQRITTITILFSVLAELFHSVGKEGLQKQIFEYIMTKNDDGDDVRILKSKTHYPYFSYFIQSISKDDKEEPTAEEEICIEETYNYFHKQLEEQHLMELLKKLKPDVDVTNLDYIATLKCIRDQILKTTFISISTKDKKQANMIFEILNAKGKKLSHVDLIKNKIFDVLNQIEPVDFAEVKWENVKKIINGGEETVGLATYYRHFWISKYKKISSNKLYDDFIRVFDTAEKQKYKDFLIDLEKNAKNYMEIINPSRNNYHNRKEFFWLVQSLNVLMNYFNIVQVRVAILALMDTKGNNKISTKIYKNTILYLENFHFAYSAIMAGNANRFENIYSKFAIEIRKAKNKLESNRIVKEELIDKLEGLFPPFDEFSKNFMLLTYSKVPRKSNVKTKYAINKINCFYEKTEVFSDDGSIEHIIPEVEGDNTLNIGNLILLEENLNGDADVLEFDSKKVQYQKSSYKWIDNFLEVHEKWDRNDIVTRASELAKMYYTNVLGKVITK